MVAIQFLLFEPEGWVPGNGEIKLAAEKLLDIICDQLKSLQAEDTRG